MGKPLVDPKSFELAGHFLQEGFGAPGIDDKEAQQWELAKVIQDAVEGWFDSHG